MSDDGVGLGVLHVKWFAESTVRRCAIAQDLEGVAWKTNMLLEENKSLEVKSRHRMGADRRHWLFAQDTELSESLEVVQVDENGRKNIF